jgi:hypothetical protein
MVNACKAVKSLRGMLFLGTSRHRYRPPPWRGLAWRKKAPLSRRHIAVGAQIWLAAANFHRRGRKPWSLTF